jgi:hypothetical protein
VSLSGEFVPLGKVVQSSLVGGGVGPQCAKQKLSSTSSVLATPTPLGADSLVEGIVKVIGVS